MIGIYQTDDGRVPSHEYLPCSAIAPKMGMALKPESGALTTATGTDSPLYLSMTERHTECESGELIPVIRIHNDMIFDAPTPEGFTAVLGQSVRLSSDGCGLSSETGGAAEVVYTDDTVTRFRIHNADAVTAAVYAADDTDSFNTTEAVD